MVLRQNAASQFGEHTRPEASGQRQSSTRRADRDLIHRYPLRISDNEDR